MSKLYEYICYNNKSSDFPNIDITFGKHYFSQINTSYDYVIITNDLNHVISLPRRIFFHTIEEHRQLILNSLINE